jgi:hypothetical protein
MTAGLLPPEIRQAYQFRYGRLEKAIFEGSLPMLRLMRRQLPERARWVPAYVAAERRLRGETRPGALDWVARKALDRATKRKTQRKPRAGNRQPVPTG